MNAKCPRCNADNREIARFCAHCGLSLANGADGSHSPGRVAHPRPAAVSPDYLPCERAPDLFFRTESSLGGETLLRTEGVNVMVFNRGYALREVELRIKGVGDGGNELFDVEKTLEEFPRDRDVVLEIPSYELSAPLRRLTVTLLSAEYGNQADD